MMDMSTVLFKTKKFVLSLPPILSFSPYPGGCFIVPTIILINLSLTSPPSSPIPWWLFHCAVITWTWLHWPFSASHHPCCSVTICSCQTFTAHTVPAYSSTHTRSQYSSCAAWPWKYDWYVVLKRGEHHNQTKQHPVEQWSQLHHLGSLKSHTLFSYHSHGIMGMSYMLKICPENVGFV